MDQARHYLKLAMYLAVVICYLMILWQFLYHKQWKMALLSLVCNIVVLGGFLVALIIGWQEAWNFKMKRLMIVYSILLPICLVARVRDVWEEATAPPPPPKIKKGAVRAAPAVPVKVR